MTAAPAPTAAEARDRLRQDVRDCIGETVPLRRRWVAAIMERVVDPLATALAESNARTDEVAPEAEDDRFSRELQAAYARGDADGYARVLSGRLRQMDKRARAANARADELQVKLRLMRVRAEGAEAARDAARTDTARIAALKVALESVLKFADARVPDDFLCTIQVYAHELRAIATAANGDAPNVEDRIAALEAEVKGLRRLPFSMDPRAQAAVLADLPESVAQEAGEFYENAHAPRPKGAILKREAMAVAWQSVLRPYLIGLRDHHDAQARPAALQPNPGGSDA